MHVHRTLTLLLALFAVVGWLGFHPAASTAQETATISLSPVEVGVAETALVEARLNCPANNCAKFEIELSFDRSLIRVQRAIIGDSRGAGIFEAENRVDNPGGMVRLSLEATSPLPPADALLFQLEVYGLVPGTNEIAVQALTITDAGGAQLAANAAPTPVTVLETGKIAQFSPPSDDWEVVFVSDRDGNPELYVINADGSGLRRLTDNEALDGGPQWSPDGSLIAFYSVRDGNFEIYVIDDTGGNLRKITNDPAPDYDPAWLPDGAHIVFVSERDGSPDLYVVPIDGSSEATRLFDETGRAAVPIWSPDNTQLAYNASGNGPVELRLVSADGSNSHSLIDLFGANGINPDWAPNGRLLSFAVERDGNADVYTILPDGSAPTKLTSNSSWPTTTAVAPDSAWVGYMAGYTGYADLYVTDTGGQHIFRLTETPYNDTQPDWRALTPGPMMACTISTDQASSVGVHVGPGRDRGQYGWLPPNQTFTVEGQALDPTGRPWFRIDKTQIGASDSINSLWVRGEDVQTSGDCAQVTFLEPPPVIITIPTDVPGGWGPCGSCDTCGHTGECVTSPDGQCLWDPGTCGPGDSGGDPGGDPGPGCFRLGRGANGPGTVSVSPGYNCRGGSGYTPGTMVTVTATPFAGAYFTNWDSDCPGVAGNQSLVVSFSMTSTCSITGNFNYIR